MMTVDEETLYIFIFEDEYYNAAYLYLSYQYLCIKRAKNRYTHRDDALICANKEQSH